MPLRTLTRLLAVAAALLAGPASAIIMRHDVDEARYRDLGEKHRGVLVAMGLNARVDGGPMLFNGMGTLIGPDWVATAAHVAEPILEGERFKSGGAGHYVFLNGRGFRVARIVVHPDYNPATSANDIALVQLTRAVPDAKPACLYEGRDETGKVALLVGQGLPGDGLKGPGTPDGALRGSTVLIGPSEPNDLTWTFHGPGDRDVTPLEGISGPGDSGGPALIETPDGFCLAGVSSNQRRGLLTAIGPEGRYGVVEVYARVSSHLAWIRSTTGLS